MCIDNNNIIDFDQCHQDLVWPRYCLQKHYGVNMRDGFYIYTHSYQIFQATNGELCHEPSCAENNSCRLIDKIINWPKLLQNLNSTAPIVHVSDLNIDLYTTDKTTTSTIPSTYSIFNVTYNIPVHNSSDHMSEYGAYIISGVTTIVFISIIAGRLYLNWQDACKMFKQNLCTAFITIPLFLFVCLPYETIRNIVSRLFNINIRDFNGIDEAITLQNEDDAIRQTAIELDDNIEMKSLMLDAEELGMTVENIKTLDSITWLNRSENGNISTLEYIKTEASKLCISPQSHAMQLIEAIQFDETL